MWIFSTITFIALIHLIEATSALVFNIPIRLLTLYPLINENLQALTPQTYFLISAAATLTFWGITCAIAFENPVETFLNQILSDAKKQSTTESQAAETKTDMLDAMCETVESNSETLAHIRDVIFNVRTEVKQIQPLTETVEKVKTELSNLKKELRKVEERTKLQISCLSCGKPLLPDFKLCPYCGKTTKLRLGPLIDMKDYK
jgi:hypothetical protein